MHVIDFDAHLLKILGQILSHLLGERRDHDLIILLGLFSDLAKQIIDLPLHGPYIHLGIEQSGGADNLLCAEQFMFCFIIRRRCGYKHHLIDMRFKFLEV